MRKYFLLSPQTAEHLMEKIDLFKYVLCSPYPPNPWIPLHLSPRMPAFLFLVLAKASPALVLSLPYSRTWLCRFPPLTAPSNSPSQTDRVILTNIQTSWNTFQPKTQIKPPLTPHVSSYCLYPLLSFTHCFSLLSPRCCLSLEPNPIRPYFP